MKRFLRCLAVVLTILTLTAGAVASLADAVIPADADLVFENGTRTRRNGLTVLNLHGTWREMGRQYGFLAADELANVASLCGEIISGAGGNANVAEKRLNTERGQMPYTIRSFFAGMAETSGLSVYQLECANAVERIAGLPHCSFVAAWDDYAAGDLVLGRNYDYGEIFHRLDHEVIVTVFHPADGETVHSYEWCTIGVERGDGAGPDGVFASTNHYVSPNWTFEAPDEEASLQTTLRRANLLNLCEARKGTIDAGVMMEIINARLEDGGAANDLTVYQIVAVPSSRTLWLKTARQDEWTEFDLGAFFAE